MDAHPTSHPTEQTLILYGLGKLDDRLAEAVNKHLEQCADCRQRVCEMSADSFLERVRDVQKPAGMSTFGQSLLADEQSRKGKKSQGPPPANTLPPGLSDHPDYEIKRELGRGGMGVVYLAHNKLMGRDEVLKVMSRHIMERAGVLERFLREIRAVAKLRHANIVTAYHAFRLAESFVFAMEYVDGLDLSKMVKAKGALPVAHACNFVYQAAMGLQHAHEEGLVHRDIKPGNLMLASARGKATVKILDFGLAKATREERVDGALTSEGQALGTPDFIAPEQILDAQSADIRADIYSLGGTLYYLLTGRPPFRRDSLYDMYQAHISQIADPLNFIRPEVPTELAALVAKMMAKDPGRRFQTPSEVAQALAQFFKKPTMGFEPESSREGRPGVKRITTAAGMTPTPPAPSITPAHRNSVDQPHEPARVEPAWASLIELKQTEELTKPASIVAESPRRWPPQIRRAIVAASVLGLIALGIVITIRTKSGEFKLTAADDKHLTAEVDGIEVEFSPSKNDPMGPGAVQAPPSGPATLSAEMTEPTAKKPAEPPVPRGPSTLSAEPTAKKPAEPPVPPVTSIDLLSMLDVNRDTTRGLWLRSKSGLISVPGKINAIQFPFSPPEEYELHITAERIKEGEDLQIGVVCGQRQCVIILDGWGGQTSGISWVDGRWGNENETTYRGRVLADNGPAHLIVTVRKQQIQVVADKRTIIDWRGDENRLSLKDDRGVRPGALFLGTFRIGSYRIDEVRLTPLSGFH